jgi:hypothetical protein
MAERPEWNASRFVPGSTAGHYESYFQRANHPDRPLAFWIRYTVFSPRGQPDRAMGELWAVYFDGESGRISASKQDVPISKCRFSSTGLDVRIGTSTLADGHLEGSALCPNHYLSWSLHYSGGQPPLLLLPESSYSAGFPKAKALVGMPMAIFNGSITVDADRVPIDGWVGSQNHNWGSQHTDDYAWGQVAGFDGATDVFLECSSARVRIGPLWTPRLTLMVLRLDGREFALNGYLQAMLARGSFGIEDGLCRWKLHSRTQTLGVSGEIRAPASLFVGLRYGNPPGGVKTCLNTKLADCELTVERPGHAPMRLTAAHRAAFEILTDRQDHGIAIVA